MSIKARLALGARILLATGVRRDRTGGLSTLRSVEREIADHELRELASEWLLNPESPAVPNIGRIR
ncbi:MAG: hypothetical protein ACRD4Q_07845 [Candidatus Acidiferrales bacterium]